MKRWYKKREQLFLFKKLTDISKQNTIFVKDVDAPSYRLHWQQEHIWPRDWPWNYDVQ
jgi:hypothetical protein